MSDVVSPVANKIGFFRAVWNGIKAVFKQIAAPFTDVKWDADAQKIVGIAVVSTGITIIVFCILKWDFTSNASAAGITLIGIGCGLLGWRGHTDV